MSEGMKVAEKLRGIWDESGDVTGEILDLATALEMFGSLTADDYNQIKLLADKLDGVAQRLREAGNAA